MQWGYNLTLLGAVIVIEPIGLSGEDAFFRKKRDLIDDSNKI